MAGRAGRAIAGRNGEFRAWLVERYGVTVPGTAAEILGDIPDMLAETSDDPFRRWGEQQDPRDAEPTAS